MRYESGSTGASLVSTRASSRGASPMIGISLTAAACCLPSETGRQFKANFGQKYMPFFETGKHHGAVTQQSKHKQDHQASTAQHDAH